MEGSSHLDRQGTDEQLLQVETEGQNKIEETVSNRREFLRFGTAAALTFVGGEKILEAAEKTSKKNTRGDRAAKIYARDNGLTKKDERSNRGQEGVNKPMAPAKMTDLVPDSHNIYYVEGDKPVESIYKARTQREFNFLLQRDMQIDDIQGPFTIVFIMPVGPLTLADIQRKKSGISVETPDGLIIVKKKVSHIQQGPNHRLCFELEVSPQRGQTAGKIRFRSGSRAVRGKDYDFNLQDACANDPILNGLSQLGDAHNRLSTNIPREQRNAPWCSAFALSIQRESAERAKILGGVLGSETTPGAHSCNYDVEKQIYLDALWKKMGPNYDDFMPLLIGDSTTFPSRVPRWAQDIFGVAAREGGANMLYHTACHGGRNPMPSVSSSTSDASVFVDSAIPADALHLFQTNQNKKSEQASASTASGTVVSQKKIKNP